MSKTIVLQNAYKGYTLDQDKIVSPDETVRRFKDKLKTLDLDILSHTKRIDNGRLNIPVYFSVCGEDAAAVTGARKQMGKGATEAQAEASATIELGERFSFFSFYQNTRNFRVDTYQNIKKDAISFDLIAQSVHDESPDLDIAKTIFERLNLKWTRGFDLTRNTPVLIPFDWFYTINEFNGSSAGNCVEEALCQGICEVVERHVSSLISQDRIGIPLIRTGSATDTMTKEMLVKYQKAGIRLYASDFTLDMGIPTVGVLAYDPATFPEMSEIVWTAGTTPSPEKAFSRALTETAQLAGDFNTGSNYMASGLPKFRDIEETEFIRRSGRHVRLDQLPDISDDNIKIEVENCIHALAKKNMPVMAVDITHPLMGLPAFYTIIPGSHFRERALGTGVGMFSCKLITETLPPHIAISELKHIDGIFKNKYYVKFYLGLCHLSLEQPREALASFQTALDLDPNPQDIPSVYSYMGVCLKETGQYREALAVLEKGLRHDMDRTDLHNLMGFCYYMLKEHENAIACFEKVIQLDPGSAIDYANIGSNYRELGHIDKAVNYYQTALSIDPTIDFARENIEKLKSCG